ncbi:3'-5' exonuclease [Acinetobacter sp. Marseille-Q1618]|uniref:3'-5' exonuclease n=1 Tax=Acinetobacter sp. Marseille-Q1618 TaxID=2697502 RepID=UPI00156F35C8|nr:3'-5' exonuclease [Acinetobacter sp. Marseille-Q1618]
MNKLMLDLETLALSDKPVIAAIGAVVFNDEKIIQEFYVQIDLESCTKVGLEIDASTVQWWLTQSPEAIQATFGGNQELKWGIRSALESLIDFYKENECQTIYGNGALNDIVWINSAIKAVGLEKPWGFREEMCFRSLRNHLPWVEIDDFDGTKHKAIDDAKWQALYLIKALKNARIEN